jgi:hypothetical protein
MGNAMGNAMEFPNVRYFHGGRLEIFLEMTGDMRIRWDGQPSTCQMNAKVKRLKLLSSSNAQFSGVYVT